MANKYLDDARVCAVDIESTGLDPENHEIVQIFICPLNTLMEPQRIPFDVTIKPLYPERMDDVVKRMHASKDLDRGFSAEKVIDLWDSYFQTLNIDKIILLGYNNAIFDCPWLKKFFGYKLYETYFHYKPIDAFQAVNLYNEAYRLSHGHAKWNNTKLTAICNELNIDLPHAHTAKDDALAAGKVYYRIMEMLKGVV